MQQYSRKRLIGYVIILILLGLLAIWVFHKPDYLRELKETEAVSAGTEPAVKVVQEAVKLIDAKEKSKLAHLMYTRDKTEFERITDSLFRSKFGPVEILGCSRLKNSSRKENLSVHVRSEARGKMYMFSMLKNRKGDFCIYDVSVTDRDPRKMED